MLAMTLLMQSSKVMNSSSIRVWEPLKVFIFLATFIPVASVFDQSPESVSAEVGSDVSLWCQAEGYPAPTIQWFHYNTVIGEIDNVTVTEETVNSTAVVSTLELSGLQTVQYGQYHCRANGDVDSEPATISFIGTYSQIFATCL